MEGLKLKLAGKGISMTREAMANGVTHTEDDMYL